MKRRTKTLLINLCTGILPLAVFVFWVLLILKQGRIPAWEIVCVSSLSFTVQYFLSVFFHEAGHLVFAGMKKIRPACIDFGLFSVDFSKKKAKGNFLPAKNNAGESVFLSPRKLRVRDLKLVAFGGLFFSFLYYAGCMAAGFCINTPLAACVFLAGGCGALYIFIVNVLPFDKTSDGGILFGTAYPRSLINLFGLYGAEEPPKESSVATDAGEPLDAYCRYFFDAYGGNMQSCALASKKLESVLDGLCDEEYEHIFPETLFFSCFEGRLDGDMKRRADAYFGAFGDTASGLRAHFVYRKITGDGKWAEILEKSYLRQVADLKPFMKKAEENLFLYAKRNLPGGEE